MKHIIVAKSLLTNNDSLSDKNIKYFREITKERKLS